MLLNNVKHKSYNFGLGDFSSTAQVNFKSGNTGASALTNFSFSDSTNDGTPSVLIKSLDSIYKDEHIPNHDSIIKIDVEGMEINVINGMKKFLSDATNIMLIIEDLHTGRNAIEKALLEIGDFTVERIDDENIAAWKN